MNQDVMSYTCVPVVVLVVIVLLVAVGLVVGAAEQISQLGEKLSCLIG